MFWSSYFTLVAEIATPEKRDRWYGLAGAAQNAGTGVGGLLGGSRGGGGKRVRAPSRGRRERPDLLLAALLLLWRVDEPRARHAPKGLRAEKHRWQDRLERPWRWVGRGCHPNRNTPAAAVVNTL